MKTAYKAFSFIVIASTALRPLTVFGMSGSGEDGTGGNRENRMENRQQNREGRMEDR